MFRTLSTISFRVHEIKWVFVIPCTPSQRLAAWLCVIPQWEEHSVTKSPAIWLSQKENLRRPVLVCWCSVLRFDSTVSHAAAAYALAEIRGFLVHSRCSRNYIWGHGRQSCSKTAHSTACSPGKVIGQGLPVPLLVETEHGQAVTSRRATHCYSHSLIMALTSRSGSVCLLFTSALTFPPATFWQCLSNLSFSLAWTSSSHFLYNIHCAHTLWNDYMWTLTFSVVYDHFLA